MATGLGVSRGRAWARPHCGRPFDRSTVLGDHPIDIDESALSRREYLGVKLAEYMAGDPNYIPDAFYDELKAEYTEEEVVELIFGCSVFNFGNKFNITMRLDASEESKYPTGMTYPLQAAQVAAE